MTIYRLIHRAEVTIGPLTEQEGGGPKNQGIKIIGTGSDKSLRVQFNVQKTLAGAPNKVQVNITGLKEATRRRVQSGLTSVSVSAGYERGPEASMRELAKGGVLSCLPRGTLPDIITEINALDGFAGRAQGTYRKSFSGPVPVRDVVLDVARSMPGIIVSESTITVQGTLGPRGGTFAGASADILDELGDQWGFSWSVQNGVFQALDDDRSLSRIILASWRDGSLLDVQPTLTGPEQVQTAIEARLRLDARVDPGVQVRIESKVNSSLNGLYPVHTCESAGDTHGELWETKITSFVTL
jgi:hypothetical protein